ncbi:hypothetical protein ACFPOE_11415 [Caenimonas terrae]|uniref:Terminase small subunit n=1 Tax=Caenimonas terrae TaxID=696074 RepID=A0ABW0NDW4_9BURK
MAKSDPKLLTQAEYARHRKARGLSGGSREAVRKAVDRGHISVFGPDKLVDQVLADTQWERNTRVRASAEAPATGNTAQDLVDAAGAEPAAAAASPAPADQVTGPGEQLHADPGYQLSRSRQAAADARTAEIKLAELEGSLIRVDQVKSALASMLAPVREGLLQIPARLAPLLAPQSDPGRIQTLLEAEIHQVLAPLARASALGGGTSEQKATA